MESDMLRRYTQHTLVDDLLPSESNIPLLSQEVEVETRRGGTFLYNLLIIDATNISMGELPRVDDSFDVLDGGMEMESLSDDV